MIYLHLRIVRHCLVEVRRGIVGPDGAKLSLEAGSDLTDAGLEDARGSWAMASLDCFHLGNLGSLRTSQFPSIGLRPSLP